MSNRFEVVLSLKDADTVKRGLQSLGADGEKALKRLETATQPASKGLQLLDQATGALKGGLQELASHAGPAGKALELLGKGGLGAAAGLGAIAVAIAAAVKAARAATQHFGDIADAAQRAGTSAENFQTLQRVAEANASSAEELGKALETLRLKIDEAAGGSKQAQDAFQRSGVSMEFLQQHGGDTAAVFNEISKHGATAADAVELLGRGGKGLLPTLSDLNGRLSEMKDHLLDTQKIASEQVVKAFDDLADNSVARLNESFAKWSGLLLDVASGLNRTANAGHELLSIAADLLGKLKAIEEGASRAGERLSYTLTQRRAWESPEGMRAALRQGVGLDPDIRHAEDTGQAVADPGKPGLGSLAVSARRWIDDKGVALDKPIQHASGGGRSRAAKEPDLGLEMGKAFGDKTLLSTGGGLDRVETTEIEPSYAWKQQHAEADAFYETLSKITEQTTAAKDETAKWYDQITLNTLGIHEAASSIGGLFADAATGEKKVADVLVEIPNLISKIIIQKMVELAITQAIAAASGGMSGAGGALSGLFGSIFGGGGAGSSGGAPMVSGGANPGFLLGGAAHGAIISHGRADHLSPITAFARGGIIDEPTLFPLHHGMGVAGEAGPEVAIAPLRRMASGDLGVQAAAPKMTVIINNHAGAEVQTRQERGADGSSRLIIDMLKQEIASDMARPGTGLNRAIGAANSPLRPR